MFADSTAQEQTQWSKTLSRVSDKLRSILLRAELPEVKLQARLLQRFDRTCLDMHSNWL